MAVDPGLSEAPVIWQLVDSSTVGGIESHVAALTLALRERGRAAKIVCLQRHGDNPWFVQLSAKGLPLAILPGGFWPLLAALRRDRPSILHTHGYKAGIMGRMAGLLAGVPVASTFHAGERGAFPVSLYQAVDGLTSCLSARIAVDQGIAAKLPFKAEVIRNFIMLPQRGARSVAQAEAGSKRIVGFVGRLSHEKGPDLFCKIAERTGEGVEFHVFGDGPMRGELEKRYGGGHIRFCGLQADMESIWPRIGLLLMPSRAEGMPMAALEALAHGIPVAASRVGALPELLHDSGAGWLFEAGDVTEATKAVAAWMTLPKSERDGMEQRCRLAAEARFGPAEPVSDLLAIYDRIAPPVLAAA